VAWFGEFTSVDKDCARSRAPDERLLKEAGEPRGLHRDPDDDHNFVRIHGSLRITPAMAAGITDHPWEMEQLLRCWM
jgi:hypothetical protein